MVKALPGPRLRVIDRIKPHLIGAPDKIVAIDELGRFGLAVEDRVGGVGEDGLELRFLGQPAHLGDVLQAAVAIVSGDPRATTAPGIELWLAVGCLAVAWGLAEMAWVLVEMAWVLAETRNNPHPDWRPPTADPAAAE